MDVIRQTIKIDECLETLTIMTKAGYSNKAKEQLVEALELQECYMISDAVYYEIKTALMIVAAIKAIGINKDLQDYLGDIK